MSTDYIKYFLHGSIAGTTATIVSHPFWYLKCLAQNNERLDSYKNLYKGFTRACIGYSIEKTLVFGTYNTIINKFKLNRNNAVHTFCAGAISGLVSSITVTPAEQLTIDKGRGINNYSLKHLYKGIFPTMIRESLGFAIHFSIYDQLSKRYNVEKEVKKTILIGSVTVITTMFLIFGTDTIKTNIQSGKSIDFNIRNMYKGFHYGLCRSLPFHTTCFVVFEYLQENYI